MRILLVFVLGIHMTGAAMHTLQYFYTATSGIPHFPEFVSLGMVDGRQVDYYDSKIKKTIPKTEWMSAAEGPEYWDRQTQACLGSEEVYKNNIDIVKSRFNQSGGVHTFQRMYGCEWDDETEIANGLYQDGYDGEDFVTLDYEELRYVSAVPQGLISAHKWNNEIGNLEGWKGYLGNICIEWLKKYLQYGKNSMDKIVSPQVSLLQKDSSSPVLCHATGFYPSGVKISWLKNAQDHYEDVDIGELVPNEDGTFQKTSTLKTDEWKQNQYSCVVEHQGKTIKTILSEKDIKTNNGAVPIGIIVGVVVAAIFLIVIGVVGYMVYQKKGKSGFVAANTSDGGSNNSSQGPQA